MKTKAVVSLSTCFSECRSCGCHLFWRSESHVILYLIVSICYVRSLSPSQCVYLSFLWFQFPVKSMKAVFTKTAGCEFKNFSIILTSILHLFAKIGRELNFCSVYTGHYKNFIYTEKKREEIDQNVALSSVTSVDMYWVKTSWAEDKQVTQWFHNVIWKLLFLFR